MKTNYIYPIILALFVSTVGIAAEKEAKESIVISGTKFTYPLIEKWISEYAKVNPSSKIKLAAKVNTGEAVDLKIIAHQPSKTELTDNQSIIYTGRYALLPITSTKNPLLITAQKRALSKNEIEKLFFDLVDYDNDQPVQKSKYQATIYSRDNQACASTALATYFGHLSSEIKGKKVLGDDIYLLSAIKKDSVGIAYSNLGHIFDVNSRSIKEGIALLPVDLKKSTKPVLSGNLDDAISVLETNKIETIPVEKIGFVFSQENRSKEVTDFLKWVLADGQKFNHEKGFLNLNKESLTEQENLLTEKLLSLK